MDGNRDAFKPSKAKIRGRSFKPNGPSGTRQGWSGPGPGLPAEKLNVKLCERVTHSHAVGIGTALNVPNHLVRSFHSGEKAAAAFSILFWT